MPRSCGSPTRPPSTPSSRALTGTSTERAFRIEGFEQQVADFEQLVARREAEAKALQQEIVALEEQARRFRGPFVRREDVAGGPPRERERRARRARAADRGTRRACPGIRAAGEPARSRSAGASPGDRDAQARGRRGRRALDRRDHQSGGAACERRRRPRVARQPDRRSGVLDRRTAAPAATARGRAGEPDAAKSLPSTSSRRRPKGGCSTPMPRSRASFRPPAIILPRRRPSWPRSTAKRTPPGGPSGTRTPCCASASATSPPRSRT